jgi:cyanophycinase
LYTNAPEVGASDPLSLFNLRVHVLTHGDRYNVEKRTIVLPEHRIAI